QERRSSCVRSPRSSATLGRRRQPVRTDQSPPAPRRGAAPLDPPRTATRCQRSRGGATRGEPTNGEGGNPTARAPPPPLGSCPDPRRTSRRRRRGGARGPSETPG